MTVEPRHACTYCGGDAEGQRGWTARGRACDACTRGWALTLGALLGLPSSWDSEGFELSWDEVRGLIDRAIHDLPRQETTLRFTVSDKELRRLTVAAS